MPAAKQCFVQLFNHVPTFHMREGFPREPVRLSGAPLEISTPLATNLDSFRTERVSSFCVLHYRITQDDPSEGVRYEVRKYEHSFRNGNPLAGPAFPAFVSSLLAPDGPPERRQSRASMGFDRTHRQFHSPSILTSSPAAPRGFGE
jgi:hypothetical protein